MSAPISHSLFLPRDWWNFTWYLARDNLLRQYRRTKLGPFWIVLTQFVLIFGIAIVFFTIFNRPFGDFLPFISAGILSWNFIAMTVTSAPKVYVSSSELIQSFRLPFAVFPLQSVVNNFAVFLHGLPVHALVLIITDKPLWLLPLALLMAGLVALILYPFAACIGIVGSRFGDLAPAVISFMYMAFLITPIIWEKKIIASKMSLVVLINPFAHMIDIIRQPMLGRLPPIGSVLICAAMAVVSVVAGEYLFRRYSRPLPFWV